MTSAFTEHELETLMDRPVCRLLTPADRRAFAGLRVLVTGAGGSIGAELARQIARCRPAHLTLVDRSEFNLFQVDRLLAEAAPHVPRTVVLGDVTRGAIDRACRTARPHVVYHAAAYKHVTMLERAVCAAVDANVLGTARTVEAARDVGARFVLVSSDKAAAPRSVMGATKRLAELVALARATDTFRPIVVRFGNVLGSSGSVLEIMRERIRQGRPVPVTDPAATRYFMTAGEAVALVLKADLLAERPETYWLDMGAPVTIGDLAARLIEIEAETGHAPVPIEVIGLRPGEKLREELTTQGLRLCRTRHRRIFVARQARGDRAATARALRRLRYRVSRGDELGTLEALSAAVPDFGASPEAWTMARARRIETGALADPARRAKAG